MTRLYIQPSWIDSCSDHGEWSGGNDQYRGDKSVEVVPTYINGRPNVRAFSDEAIEARRAKKKTSIPLKARILPQASRVDKLRSEAIELEAAFKAGEFSPEEYTLLRDVQFKKLRRAEELLKKATSVRPVREETEEVGIETPHSSCDLDYTHTEVVSSCGASWIDELSSENSLKNILKKACVITKTLVRYSQATKRYIKTLQEV